MAINPADSTLPSDQTLLWRQRRREWLGLGLLFFLALGWLGWDHMDRLRQAESAQVQRLAANVRSLEINLLQQLRSARASLQALRDDFSGTVLPPGYADSQMRTLLRAWHGVRTIDWLDAQGRVLASSDAARLGTVPSVGVPPPAGGQGLGTPGERLIVSRGPSLPDQAPSIDIALQLPPEAGQAGGGMIVAALDPAYFSTLLRAGNYAEDMWSALALADGRVLVFEPPNPQLEGANVARPGSLFSRHLATGQAESVQIGPSLFYPARQIAVERTLRGPELPLDKDLVVASARDLDKLLAPVWRQSGVAAALLALFAVAAAAGLVLVQRSRAAALAGRLAHQAQAAAQAEFLALALRGGDLALWQGDLNTGRGQSNDRWYEMLGLKPGEVSADHAGWVSLVHPEDRDRVVEAQDAHVRGETPAFEQRYRLRHKLGHWVWVLDRACVVEYDGAGRALRMAGTHLDITEAVQREEALRASEQNLAVTLQSIGDAVIATDAQGRITRLNPTAERLLGWTLAEALGRPLAEVFRIVNARTRLPSPDPVRRVLDTGEVVGLANDTLLLARGGAEYQIADSAAPIRTDDGGILGVVLVFSDVTEGYRVQQALREREQQLSTISDALPAPVIQTSLDMRILFVNAAFERWRAVSAADVLGRRLDEVLPPEAMDHIAPHIAQVHAGQTVRFLNVIPTPEGLRHALVVLVPDRDETGAVCGHFAVLTDITEQQQAEEALRLSEQKARQLLAALPLGVAVHDPQNRVLDANPKACELLGLSLDQMRGVAAADPAWHFVEEDGSRMAAARYPAQQVHDSGQALRNLVGGIVRSGQADPVWVLCNAFPLKSADGQLVEIIVTVLDISERKRANEALQRSEARLRTASRMARLGSWRIDVAAQTLSYAPDLAQMLEMPADKPQDIGAGLSCVVASERSAWEKLLADSVATGQGFDDVVRLLLPSGRELQMRVLGEPVVDASGRVVALDGAMLDVTEARQAQQQLLLLHACVQRLNDAVLITEAQPLHEPGPRIVFVNEAFERITGWKRKDVLGRSPRLLQGPDTDRSELARIGQALQQAQSVRAELMNYTAAGQPYWVEVEIAPVWGSDGTVTNYVAVQRDATERKQAEFKLQSVRDELAATLAAVPDLLFDVDLEGVIHSQHSPRRELLAAPQEAIVGNRLDDFIPGEAAAVVRTALKQAHETGSSSGLQYELDLPDGSHWFELSVSRKLGTQGGVPRFIALARDISERKQGEAERRTLERQLREMQKMESIGTLAGGIAHDFNNILAAILGNVSLAADDLPAAHPARSSLDQIQKAGLRARTLVQQILTFSRRHPQKLAVQPLRPVLDETLALLRATLPAGVQLRTQLAEEVLLVRAEATQLQQVLMNLCTNAWQALPTAGGIIEVGLALADAEEAGQVDEAVPLELPPGPCAHLWVRDNGAGIEPALRERIFDPFFTTKPVGQGTGLGLSVVHGIVRGHGGVITLESASGQGSSFHVWLPLGDVALQTAPAGSVIRPDGQGAGRHVLYVDDDEVMLLMVQRLLQRAGWQVSVCSTADEALALLRDPSPGFAAVVTDFNMPGMSGLDLARQLHDLHPDLPVIISSGHLSDELREQSGQLGVQALMKKENTLEELAGLLGVLISPLP